jgi:hypothetical protein
MLKISQFGIPSTFLIWEKYLSAQLAHQIFLVFIIQNSNCALKTFFNEYADTAYRSRKNLSSLKPPLEFVNKADSLETT